MRVAYRSILFLTIFSLIALIAQSPAAAQSWANGCLYRRAITIDHTKVSNTDQASFPVLISGTYSYLATTANGGGVTNANGYDILFASDANGVSPLSFEQESYNASTGAVVYWVKLPTLSHTTDTVFYLFYGNSSISTDQSNKTAVWDSNFLGIWHSGESSGNLLDSTSHNNPATPSSLTQGTTGQIGNGASYNGSNSHAAVGNLSLFNPSLITASAWVYATSYATSYNHILAKEQYSDPYEGYDLRVDGGHLNFFIATGGAGSYKSASATQPSTGSWHHVAGSYDGSNIKLFLDGSLVSSVAVSGNMSPANASLWFGNDFAFSSGSWNGTIDEVRISNIARSADWVSTEYKNQSSPSTFYSVGSAAQGTITVSITGLSPITGNFGDAVVLQGINFGAMQGNSTVSLNGISAVPQRWSNTDILVNVPVGGSTGYFSVTVGGQTAVSPLFTVKPLPSGWSDGDVGAVGLAGSATYANGTFTVQGSGQGVVGGYNSDALHFVHQTLSGDGTIVARIVSLPQGASAGVMIRETLDQSSTHGYSSAYSGRAYFHYRTSTGGTNSYDYNDGNTLPVWVKLVRNGNTFKSYWSPDGDSWFQVGTTQTITMAQSVYIGLAVANNTNSSVLATVTFDSVSISSTASPAPTITSASATTGSVGSQVIITGSGFGASQNGSLATLNNLPVTINSWSNTSIILTIPSGATSGPLLVSLPPSMNDSNPVDFTVTTQPLPSPWLDDDLGLVGIAGNAGYASGTFTVNGAGTATKSSYTADAFHFVYQPLSGDGTIVARVVSAATSTWAGVMIRETFDQSSTHGYTILNGGTPHFYWRTTTGGANSGDNISSESAPYWVKLVRTGNSFNAYASPDGVTWTQISSTQTISMAHNVYAGLAAASGYTSTLATATFDNVSFLVGTSPFVTGVSPDLGPTGTSVTITGSNFGATQGTSTVSFGGVLATSITSWSSSQIVATVPYNAPSGPGLVTVTVNSISSPSNITFDVIKPIISSFTPPSASVGGTVTMSGSGFGPSVGNSTVQFNGLAASTSAWSDTSVTLVVPSGATSGPVTVTEDGVTSSGVQFTVLEALSVTGVSPSSGPVGTTVTISGAGFGSTQSNSILNFYGAAATNIHSWSDTQIVATIPSGVATGPAMVTVASNTGVGPTFTLTKSLQLTDSLGNATTYSAQQTGGMWVPSSSQGSGCSSCTMRGTISYTYDNQGHALTKTDENGHTSSYTYDSNGNVLTVTVPITSSTSATTTYTYNSFGEVLTTTDPLGNVTTNTYDSNGNLLTVTTPVPSSGVSASVTHFVYNSLGELTQITDPLSNVTKLTYTTAGLIATITDAQNNVTTYGYDTHGNRTSVTDAMSNQTTFAYDSGDRLKTITYPGGSITTTFGYDYRGRRTSVTDQNGKTTTYAYDDADRLTSVTDAASNVTTYGYDTENNLTSIKDANNHTTSFTYDAFGRVTKTTFPSGYVETYGYDAVGNLTGKTDRKNQQITYTYDQLNRLTGKTYPDTTAVNYTYDNDSRLTQVTDPTGTYQFTFDNMGRLTQATTSYSFLTGRNFTTSYAYDAASHRTGFTDPESGATSYVFDTLNRLQTLTPPSAFSGTGSFGFTYDALSRRTQMTRPNGLKSVYAYDTLSRLLSVLHQSGSTTLDGAAYAVDNAGNRTSRTPQPSGTASNYAYDNIYELTGVTQNATTTESYSYDPVGNRLSSLGVSPYTNNSSNELTSTPSATYTYDYNGNTLTKVVGSNTTSYAWDFENRMSSVTLPGSSGTISFKYDPFGRRIYKSSSTATSVYAYDGDNLVEETNSSGAAVARYEPTQNIDEPLAMLRSGATSYFHADGLGSVTSLSNAAGSIANTYTYDSFGKLTASTGSLVNPFQYTARESDTETGLYYYRARYYDQASGRFISEDKRSMGSLKEVLNLYPYVLGNPVNFNDPLGLWRLKPDVDYPNPRISALLDCIEWQTGLSLLVNSTSEPPPFSPHSPNDVHRRDGGLAVDIHYPSDPEWVLNASACCGAKNAINENLHPSGKSTGPHLHVQLVPGPDPGNPGGDLPKNPICKGCKK